MRELEISNINDFDFLIDDLIKEAINNSSKNNHAAVIALHGDLGSGKTTFTKRLAKKLGVDSVITSPTFVIEKRFNLNKSTGHGFKKLIHIDTYRIDLQDELMKLNWQEDVSNPENIISIEWPENVNDILPKNTIHIYFEFLNETTRKLRIDING